MESTKPVHWLVTYQSRDTGNLIYYRFFYRYLYSAIIKAVDAYLGAYKHIKVSRINKVY